MRKLLLLPMILLAVLTLGISCQSLSVGSKIDIAPFSIPKPAAPELLEVPTDSSEAVRILTLNLSRMDTYSQTLELYINLQESYYKKIINFLFK